MLKAQRNLNCGYIFGTWYTEFVQDWEVNILKGNLKNLQSHR